MTRPVLLSIGSINADFQMRLDRPVGDGETLPVRDFTRLSGGKAANRAYLARRLGHAAILIGRVGQDDLRRQALAGLSDSGVDLGGVSAAAGHATAVSVIAVPPSGNKSILLAANANDAWDEVAAQAVTDRIAAAPDRSVLTADCEVPVRVVRLAAEAARARAFRVVLDPSWPDRVERDLLACAFAVAPNAKGTQTLVGIECGDFQAAGKAARRLTRLGPHLALIKLDGGGCVFAEAEGDVTHISPVPVEVVDTTGAGDAFTGALAVALLEGMAALEAALFAAAASHLTVTGWGSQPAYRRPPRPAPGAIRWCSTPATPRWRPCAARLGSRRCHAEERALGDALRLHAFHLLQTASPHTATLDAGLPARGWQEAYFGQVLWDQGFAFPFFALRLPGLARALLLYRWRRLGAAREVARDAGLCGAMFPWRSATTGREETPALQPNPLDGRWVRDDTRLQHHVGLMIAATPGTIRWRRATLSSWPRRTRSWWSRSPASGRAPPGPSRGRVGAMTSEAWSARTSSTRACRAPARRG